MKKVWIYKRKKVKGYWVGWYESGKRKAKALPRRELADGPNLARSELLIVQNGNNGAAAIYLNCPNESNLRQALDNVIKVYDVEFEDNAKLRYIHKVKDMTDVYFFANVGQSAVDTYVRLRGKLMMEVWDPHTGKFSVPEYSHAVEDGQGVTRIKLTLSPVHSLFIVKNQLEGLSSVQRLRLAEGQDAKNHVLV